MWIEANYLFLTSIEQYLYSIEEFNAFLSAKFCKKGLAYWPKECTIYLHYTEKKLNALVVLEATQLYVYLSQKSSFYNFNTLFMLLEKHRLSSIWGNPEHLVPFKYLGFSLQNIHINYQTMVYKLEQPLPKLQANTAVIEQSMVQHFNQLKTLEEAFYFEEVYVEGMHLTDMNLVLKIYKKRLNVFPSFHLEKDGLIVSKACFSELSFHYFVLGGVFTSKPYRNLGYSSQLLTFMLAYAKKQKKGVWLFVKENNQTALNLYKKLGFTVQNNFQIIYKN